MHRRMNGSKPSIHTHGLTPSHAVWRGSDMELGQGKHGKIAGRE